MLFWAGNVVLTPLILLVTLFSDRKRTLHDLLLGTVVSRSGPLNAFKTAIERLLRKCEGRSVAAPSQSC